MIVADVRIALRFAAGKNCAHLIGAEVDGNRDPHALTLCGREIDWSASVDDESVMCTRCLEIAGKETR